MSFLFATTVEQWITGTCGLHVLKVLWEEQVLINYSLLMSDWKVCWYWTVGGIVLLSHASSNFKKIIECNLNTARA